MYFCAGVYVWTIILLYNVLLVVLGILSWNASTDESITDGNDSYKTGL